MPSAGQNGWTQNGRPLPEGDRINGRFSETENGSAAGAATAKKAAGSSEEFRLMVGREAVNSANGLVGDRKQPPPTGRTEFCYDAFVHRRARVRVPRPPHEFKRTVDCRER